MGTLTMNASPGIGAAAAARMLGTPFERRSEPIPPRAISSMGLFQQRVTGTTNTELVATRPGSRIRLHWLQVGCRNATATDVTIFEGTTPRLLVQLNATIGWWLELPPLPPDALPGNMGGLIFETPGSLNFTGDTAGATLDVMAIVTFIGFESGD